VRSLSTETLNLLGSGVSYSYGDMTDYRSLLDAMEDVDKVVFAAEGADEEKELVGLREVMRAFQDTRTFMYGEAEATKLSLFKMRKDDDFNQWKVETSRDEAINRLASAGIGQQPSTVYWKRSPEAKHNNGVLVGRVFDTYLGSAVVSCGLRGRAAPLNKLLAPSAKVTDEMELQMAETETSAIAESDAEPTDYGAPLPALDLGEYSGLIVKAIGDGKVYTAIVRTDSFERDGIEFQADFAAAANTFSTARLPFSSFSAYRGGRKIAPADAPELERSNIVGIGLGFFPIRNDPSKTTGEFYLSVAHIKAYRKRDEPEMVYISDAGVQAHWRNQMTQAVLAPTAAATTDADEAAATGGDGSEEGEGEAEEAAEADDQSRQRRVQIKLQGEDLLRRSGLTYFIARPGVLLDGPGGGRLAFSQSIEDATLPVSRTDVAEVVVKALLDPRACNVACSVTQSEYTKIKGGEQDISKMLEVMQPNRM